MIIDQWHKERGWKGIGYHYVITNGFPNFIDYKEDRIFENLIGQVETGRPLNSDKWLDADEIGAHAYGYNSDSIAICLIHKDKPYNEKMLTSLFILVKKLIELYDISVDNVIGHYEIDKNKPQCPSIDMEKFRYGIKHFLNSKQLANDFNWFE
jgi:N-acetylmuramoyl-L-alanine amidase